MYIYTHNYTYTLHIYTYTTLTFEFIIFNILLKLLSANQPSLHPSKAGLRLSHVNKPITTTVTPTDFVNAESLLPMAF